MVATAQAAPADINRFRERKQMTQETTGENFTMIPNAFLDEYMAKVKSVAELKVTLAIFRKTVGFQKTEDLITVSQFQKLTGLSRPAVEAGLKAALDSGLIVRRAKSQYFVYSLKPQPVKNVNQLTNLTSKESLPEPVKNVNQLDEKPVKNLYSQKKEVLNKPLNKKIKTTEAVSDEPAAIASTTTAIVTETQVVETNDVPEEQTPPSSRQVEAPASQPTTPDGQPSRKPKGSGKVRDPAADPNSSHPAIKVFQDTLHRFPEKIQMPGIIQAVGDDPSALEEWRKALTHWALHGRWDRTNIAGMINCYQKRSYERDDEPRGRRSANLAGNGAAPAKPATPTATSASGGWANPDDIKRRANEFRLPGSSPSAK